MTSPGAGPAPVRSRWSDSTLSTTLDVASSAPTSPPGFDSPIAQPRPPTIREEPPPAQEHQNHVSLIAPRQPSPARFSQPAPLRKSTTSSSQRSGEITIMLDPGVPVIPRPKSTSQLPHPTLRIDPPALELPDDLAPAPLKSRYFQPDRSISSALNSPSSLMPSPGVISPRHSPSHTRSRSETATPLSRRPPPLPDAPPRPETIHTSSQTRHIAPSNDFQPSRPTQYGSLLTPFQDVIPPVSPSMVRHKRSHSASDPYHDQRKSRAVSAVSEMSEYHLNASSGPLQPAPARGHVRNQSSLSAVSAMSSKDFASDRASHVGSASSRRITRGRLKGALPQPPASKQAGISRGSNSIGSVQSKGSSILERIGSRLRDHSRYQRLDDTQEEAIGMQQISRITSDGSHVEAPVGIDLTSFMGPGPQTMHKRFGDDDVLEAKGHLTGGLGVGMSDIVTRTLEVPTFLRTDYLKSPTRSLWPRGDPSPTGQTLLGQKAAESEGTVVAIEEPVHIDLSNVEGRQDAPVQDLMAEESTNQSYYFPPDPEMPNWRPVTMRAWWIISLIVLAVAFIATIETLVYLGNRPKGLMSFTDPDKDVSTGDWFVWKYLPEGIFVTYGILFQATDFEVRRLEPYYQMSQPTGAKAAEALNMDYLTFMSYLIPFKAFKHRQWAVLHSSVATILSSALTPVLFSAALNMDPPRDKRMAQSPKTVRMDPVWSRILEATLVLVVVEATLLFIQLRRKSGLVSNPKGIAGIAAMATKSHILNDFRGLDRASHRDIHKHLAHRRYILHKTSLWQGEYITRADTSDIENKSPQNPHPMAMHVYFVLAFISFLVFFLIFIPIAEFNEYANRVTDKAPWFLTLLATFVKLMWTNLETSVRMLQPFYVLSRRHAPPRTLLLDYTGTVPGYMPIKAAINSHFLLATVGLGSLLCEVLTVVVSSFNIDGRSALKNGGGGGETKRSYVVSFALAVIIPCLLILMLLLVYLRRRHAFLPRQPGTIASVLAFLAQSKMLYEFVAQDESLAAHTSDQDFSAPDRFSLSAVVTRVRGIPLGGHMDVAQQTVRVLEKSGKMYGLGWYRGRDGMDHLGIDEEELLADYRHGVDWSKGRMGLGEIGRWENL